MQLTATEVRVLSRLLERARALPPDAREAWLAALPEAQQVLVPRLRERLAQLASADEPAPPPPPPPKPPPPPEQRVGPYRLLEPLGGDDQGHVWRAERVAGVARKVFALRLPALPAEGMAAPNPAERQVVLLPAHADIVRLVDAGTDAAGRFYRVLPHVDGLGLLQHAKRRGLSERQRVQLMLRVCALVSHVHDERVACGELSLAKLRVDDDGRVLLLDWGQGRTLREASLAADLHALGGILQALLSDTEPGATPAAVAPTRPARAANPDLDRVLQRAQQAAGAPPYASVQALVDDLQHVLAFRPVPGAQAGTLHRARLLLQRNRLRLAAGVLVCVVLVIAGHAGWRAYERGRGQAQRADQVRAFLAEQLPELAPAGAAAPAASAAPPAASAAPPDIGVEAPRLQRALERARMGFAGEPVLRGQVITALAVRFRALGQPEQALAVLREAVALLQGTADANDPALLAARAELALQLQQAGATR